MHVRRIACAPFLGVYSISASGKGYARFGAIQIMASVDGRPFSPPSAWSPRSTSEKPPDQQQNNLVAVDVATMNDTSKSEGNNSQFRPITADTILLPKEGFSPKSKHRKFFNDNGKSIMNDSVPKHTNFRKNQEGAWESAYLDRLKNIQRQKDMMKYMEKTASKVYSWQTVEEEPIRKRENGRLPTSVPRRRIPKHYQVRSRTVDATASYSLGSKNTFVDIRVRRSNQQTLKEGQTIDLPKMPINYNPNSNDYLFTNKMLIPTLKRKGKESFYPSLRDKRPAVQRQNHKANKTKAINRLLHKTADNRSRSQYLFPLKGSLSEGFNSDHKIQELTKPKQQQENKHILFRQRSKQDFHESKGNYVTREPFQKGGLLTGNLKKGTVTVQNRMIPRRPIIRVSPIQRRISNLLNDTF